MSTKKEVKDRAESFVKAMSGARSKVMKRVKETGKLADKMACPVCNIGYLRYVVDGSLNHIAAKCDTGYCIAWKE